MGATSGDVNQSISFVELESYLTDLPTTNRTSGDRAFVRLPVDPATTGQLFFLDRDSVLPLGPGVILTSQAAATSPASRGRWLSERMYGAGGGGGGGECIIPDGGTLSGEITCHVICEGNATITGPLTITGSLLVRGDLLNEGGYPVTVFGNLTAKAIKFDKTDTSTPQSNIFVGGDLLFGFMRFLQCGGTAAAVFVGGDLIGDDSTEFPGRYSVLTYLLGYGTTSGTPGIDLVVCGDAVVSFLHIWGADGTTSPAGRGGTVNVYGDLNVGYDLRAYGGDGEGFDGGYGGEVYVNGSIHCSYASILLGGGGATNAGANDGGYIECAGTVSLNYLDLDGGLCTSTREMDVAGSGGGVTFYSYVALYSLSARGGDRYGDNAYASRGGPRANGGYVEIYGDLFANGDVDLRGGSVNTTLSSNPAGIGGDLKVAGNFVCQGSVIVSGGSNNNLDGGDGGTLDFGGDARILGTIDASGGYSDGSRGGDGRVVTARGNLNVDNININGGYGTYGGGGGDGGFLNVQGLFRLSSVASIDGGYCNSTESYDSAGNAGQITCAMLTANDTTISLVGGARFGSTFERGSNTQSVGGNFIVYGDAVAGVVDGSASTITTDYPNGVGGHGGIFVVWGTLTAEKFQAIGGYSAGDEGGFGGALICEGHATVGKVTLTGGQSDPALNGDPATINGYGGTVTANGGLTCDELDQRDGAGSGSAPTAITSLNLRAGNFINTLAMTDRVDAYIRGSGFPTTLKVLAMPFKKTLNNSDGTPTASLATTLDSSIYSSGATGWYAITGISI